MSFYIYVHQWTVESFETQFFISQPILDKFRANIIVFTIRNLFQHPKASFYFLYQSDM